jgi:hypothetical protein
MKIMVIVVLLLWMVTISSCHISRSTPVLSNSEATVVKPTSDTMQPSSATASPTDMGVVVIQGIFDPTGENLLELKPVHRYAYSSPPIPNQATGRFLVKVFFRNGEVTTVPFDALVADDAGRTQHGFFEITVPVSDEIDYILITDAMGAKTFTRINASDIIP